MSSSVTDSCIFPPASGALRSSPFIYFRNTSSFINSDLSSLDSATSPLLNLRVFVICWPPGLVCVAVGTSIYYEYTESTIIKLAVSSQIKLPKPMTSYTSRYSSSHPTTRLSS